MMVQGGLAMVQGCLDGGSVVAWWWFSGSLGWLSGAQGWLDDGQRLFGGDPVVAWVCLGK
jgi:hypothetical protein